MIDLNELISNTISISCIKENVMNTSISSHSSSNTQDDEYIAGTPLIDDQAIRECLRVSYETMDALYNQRVLARSRTVRVALRKLRLVIQLLDTESDPQKA